MYRLNARPIMEQEGAGGAGGGGDTPPGSNAGGGAGAGSPPADWFGSFASDEVKGYVKAKGFKDAEALADAYRNLEKTRGVPAERLLTLPSDDKPESWAQVFSRLGRPDTADGYELADVPNGNPEFQKWMKSTFHELGLTKKQAEAFSQKFAQNLTAAGKAQADELKITKDKQIMDLKTKWGAAAAQNAEKVDAFIQAAGITEEQATAMENALGFDGFMEIMYGITKKFGVNLGEAPFHSGGMGGGNSFGAMTPSEAKARIDMLRSDTEWKAKFANGDSKAVQEWNNLHAYAYPS